MEGSRSPSLWWRKRPRSFGETTDISEYPRRGAGWRAATAPLAPRRASRPSPDRTRYASQCDAVRYATGPGGIKALLTEPPFSAPPSPPPRSPRQRRAIRSESRMVQRTPAALRVAHGTLRMSKEHRARRSVCARVSVPSREHVLRLHRWRLISPARTLVTEDGRHLGVGELVGERGHGGRVGHTADGFARQAT